MLSTDSSIPSSPWPFKGSPVIAHRGGGISYPENTLHAISSGKHKHGFDSVEFDVKLSKDGVPMLMHDEKMTRTLNLLAESADHGKFHDKEFKDFTYDELKELDVGSWLDPSHSHARIPTLEEVVKYCIEHNIRMNVEIKPCPGTETKTGLVVAQLLKSYFSCDSHEQEVLVSSYSIDTLRSARTELVHEFVGKGGFNRWHFALILDTFEEVPDWQQYLKEINACALHCEHICLQSAEQVQEIKKQGYAIMCFVVNEHDVAARLFDWGVDAICTDMMEKFSPNTYKAPIQWSDENDDAETASLSTV